MNPFAIGYIRKDRAPGHVEYYRREVRAFLRSKHYHNEIRIIVADGPEDLKMLLTVLTEIGAAAVGVPDLSHLDGQLQLLGEVVDVWGTSSGQFWQQLKPALSEGHDLDDAISPHEAETTSEDLAEPVTNYSKKGELVMLRQVAVYFDGHPPLLYCAEVGAAEMFATYLSHARVKVSQLTDALKRLPCERLWQ